MIVRYMKDLYEYSTPELVRLLGNRFRESLLSRLEIIGPEKARI